jgi:hypothetical protein
MRYFFFFLAAVFISTSVMCDEIPEVIDSFGTKYVSACLPKSEIELKAQIIKLAGQHKPSQAWKLAHVLLCESNKAAERYALTHMAEHVLVDEFFTGSDAAEEPSPTYIDRNVGLMMKGRAWGVSAASWRPHSIEIQTFDAVCVTGMTLLFFKNNWLLTEVATACD